MSITSTPGVATPFEKILNFRDVASIVKTTSSGIPIRHGLLFRSGTPDEATVSDREALRNKYQVKTILDLRTKTEHINAAKKHADNIAIAAQSEVVPVTNNQTSSTLKIPGINYAEINLNGKGFERSLLWQLSYFSLAKLVTLMALGYRMEAISILGREVLLPRGLTGLGLDTLQHSGPEIKQIFDVLADRTSWPVLVHCTQGKDRTGLIVLLVLLLLKADIQSTTQDYIKSEQELAPEMAERMKEITSIGLDESFAKCPKDFPASIEEYLNQTYGGINAYLDSIGVDNEKIVLLRSILLNTG